MTTSFPYLSLFEGCLVSLIWASSFVFVKIGMEYTGPFTIGGLRYFLAFLLLLPIMAIKRNSKSAYHLSRQMWVRLVAIGLGTYTIGNGAFYWGLKYLTPTTVSFLLNLSPLVVLIASLLWMEEFPTRRQILGVIITLLGSALFFSPGLKSGEPLGIAVVLLGLLGFNLFGILGRGVAREDQLDTFSLTALPLGIGGALMLLIALPLEGLPIFGIKAWLVVGWLAVINTALAYSLYNHSLKELTALEMNVLLSLSPLGTAIMSWFILGEELTAVQILGLVIVIVGVLLVQHYRAVVIDNPAVSVEMYEKSDM